MSYAVGERVIAARPTFVIAAETTWDEFPSLWRQYGHWIEGPEPEVEVYWLLRGTSAVSTS